MQEQKLGQRFVDEDEDEEKPLMVTKRRMKLGMVKARSINSLLSQTNRVV